MGNNTYQQSVNMSGGLKGAETWLFQLNDIIFGPVSVDILASKLFEGEINLKTKVSGDEGATWQQIEQIEKFTELVEELKDEIKKREQEKAEKKEKLKKSIIQGIIKSIGASAVFGIMFGIIHIWLVEIQEVNKDKLIQFKIIEDELKNVSNMLMLKAERENKKQKALKLKTEKEAADKLFAQKQLVLESAKLKKESNKKKLTKKRKKKRKRKKYASSKKRKKVTLKQEVSKNINKSFSNIKNCLKTQLKRTPDLSGKLIMEFVILNSGKVGNINLHHPMLEDSKLKKCLTGVLSKWRFSKYSGERKIVRYPFIIGGKK